MASARTAGDDSLLEAGEADEKPQVAPVRCHEGRCVLAMNSVGNLKCGNRPGLTRRRRALLHVPRRTSGLVHGSIKSGT